MSNPSSRPMQARSTASPKSLLSMPKLPDARECFAKIPRWFWKIGQAGQQLFIELWFKMGFKKDKVRFPDWKLAEMCGRSLRWVQKALRQLLDAVDADGNPCPLIGRYRIYGHRDESGRVIEIVIDFAEPAPKPKAAPKPGKARPGPAPGPPSKPTSPEHLAAAAAANAEASEPAAEAVPDDVLPGETPGQYLRRKFLASAAPTPKVLPLPRPAPTPRPRKSLNPALDKADPKTLAEVLAQLEAKKEHPARE